ncbi:M48 family metalloprotease [Desulfococcaceae bacterium HSG8]|nr:M48 family metalloprotease [Desulfococcaceae bacterium HSG8]
MKNTNRREFLGISAKYALWSTGLLSGFISGCKTLETVTKVGTTIGVYGGEITESQEDSIVKAIKAAKTAEKDYEEDFTPEQEYYIGRTVGATIVNQYKPYNNPKATMFVNVLGQFLARASDRPETFGGYHFLILDSDEINAFAAPGGLIFVTRGILRCCRHETAAAAILAHEIGHVQHKHGLRAIKKSRLTSSLTTIGLEVTKVLGYKELAEVAETFGDCISDIVKTMVNNGYSRESEFEADISAVKILRSAGYNPNGLINMLNLMKKHLKPGGPDFAKTHPSPELRIAEIRKQIGAYTEIRTPPAMQARFKAALGRI